MLVSHQSEFDPRKSASICIARVQGSSWLPRAIRQLMAVFTLIKSAFILFLAYLPFMANSPFQGVRRNRIALPHEQKKRDGAKIPTTYSSIFPSPISSSIHRRICTSRSVRIHPRFCKSNLAFEPLFFSHPLPP